MTLRERSADDGVGADTDASLAAVGLCAKVSVVAGRAIRRWWIGTYAGCGITDARVTALTQCSADDGIYADADPGLAAVGLCAKVSIVAGRAVGDRWIGAHAGCGITDARDTALIEWGADYGVGADANTTLAGVGLRAEVTIIAGHAIRL